MEAAPSPAERRTSSGYPKADIVVITALREEYGAVLACLENPNLIHGTTGEPNTYAWQLGFLPSSHGDAAYAVVVGKGDPTTTYGALATAKAIQLFHPGYVVFVGCAGGFPRDGQRHGDVAVSRVVVAYEYGKVSEKGFTPRSDFTYPVDVGLARNADAASGAAPRWWEPYEASLPEPQVRTGTIASGDKVVDNPDDAFWKAVAAAWPKLLAVEMEGAGVAAAVGEAQAEKKAVGFLLVRGISDMPKVAAGGDQASTAERDSWKPLACRNAARFFAELVRRWWPVPPGSGAVEKPPATTTASTSVGNISAAGATVQVTIHTMATPVEESHGRALCPSDAATGSRSPLYNVPRGAVREFVGREDDLNKLGAALRKGGPVAVSASLEGLAGVGKTELARQMAARLSAEGRFPGGIFWFDAESPDLTSTWGGPIADDLEIDAGPVLERAKTAMQRVRKGAPALLILDNVTSWTGDAKPSPLPSGEHIGLLVTTRQLDLGGQQAFEHLSIECLDPEAAERLLRIIADRELGNAQDLAELIQYLGGHTLAVELAGAFLKATPERQPGQYLTRLRTGEKLGDKVSSQVRYERTVDHALSTIWDRLDADARSAWLVLGEMAQADATLELLEACGVREDERRALRGFHLLMSDGQRWRMHRLVRDYGARAGSKKERETARRRFVDGCAARAESIDLPTGYRIYLNEGPHLQRALDVVGAAPADSLKQSWFLDRMGIAAQSAGDFARAKHLLELALASHLETLGDDHPSVATSRSNLANVLQDLGDLPQARHLLELALASNLKTFGDDHPSVATSRSNLASVLQDLGDLPKAKRLLELALASGIKTLGDDHPSVATRRSNLASVLKDLGDLPQAKHLLELALASDLKTLGDDHPSVATSRFNLAALAWQSGQLEEARGMFAQALAAQERSLGPSHPSTAQTRARLARVLHKLDRDHEARPLAARALDDVASLSPSTRARVDVESTLAGWFHGNDEPKARAEP